MYLTRLHLLVPDYIAEFRQRFANGEGREFAAATEYLLREWYEHRYDLKCDDRHQARKDLLKSISQRWYKVQFGVIQYIGPPLEIDDPEDDIQEEQLPWYELYPMVDEVTDYGFVEHDFIPDWDDIFFEDDKQCKCPDLIESLNL
jgi:hypothetical protein